MKPRTLYFDIIRILSCFMIVFMHAQKDGVGTPGWMLAGIGYMEAAGIGLFFMISGALVLNSNIVSDDKGTVHFLYHRLKKVCIPLVAWYLIYGYANSINLENTGQGVLWFLWTIGGLYLLSPILIRWLHSAGNREILSYLGIWGISLLYPVINLVFPVSANDTSWVYYFHGYVGYFVLGYYLSHRIKSFTKSSYTILSVLFVAVSVCPPLIVLFMRLEVDFYSLFWYLSLPVAVQCVVWFLSIKSQEPWLQSLSEKSKSAIQWVSSQTFGIYLTHILIMRGWLWKTELIQSLTSVTHMVVCAVVTFVLAMCLTAGIRRVSYLRMVVGG